MQTLDDKIQELIAIGISYAINCKPCMEYHKKKAEKAGATPSEMLEAIAVGEKVRNGAHTKSKAFTNELFGEMACDTCSVQGNSCC
ncbi:MAG: carboxymuconolactone decarboxylase family protein [Geobacteraceae bacterium]|nr:carboxymuconolactone decarboxylase family protein [Geobacteraceae bacterium]